MQQPNLASRGASKAGMVFRVTSGNFLEQFDFFLFGFYATHIAAAFFPASNEFASLMMTFAVFGAGFLMRPLGAVLLGAYIDDVGRRKGLIVTLAIMASGTLLIVLVPGYASIGLWAPALVLLGRLLQGFSAGAEMGGQNHLFLALMGGGGEPGQAAVERRAKRRIAPGLGRVERLEIDDGPRRSCGQARRAVAGERARVLGGDIGDAPQQPALQRAEEPPAPGCALGESPAHDEDRPGAGEYPVRPEFRFHRDMAADLPFAVHPPRHPAQIERRKPRRQPPALRQRDAGGRVAGDEQRQIGTGAAQRVDQRPGRGQLAVRGGVQPQMRAGLGGVGREPLA